MARTWSPIFAGIVLLVSLTLAAQFWVTQPPREPRFLFYAAEAGQTSAPSPVRDSSELQHQLQDAYAGAGSEAEFRAWLTKDMPAMAERFAGVHDASWLTPSHLALMAGIAVIWFLCLIAPPGGRWRTRAAVIERVWLVTVVGALVVAALAALNASLRDRFIGANTLFGAGLAGGVFIGGAAAVVLPAGRLQRYVLKDVLWAFAPAAAALVLMMAVGTCMQMLDAGLDIVRLPKLLIPIMTYSLPMIVPAAFLTAVVVSFGRMSAGNELTAARAAGIPIFQLVRPVLGVALALCGLTAFLQFETVPAAKLRTATLKSAALKQILLGELTRSASKHVLFPQGYIEWKEFKGGQRRGVLVALFSDKRPSAVITAERAQAAQDPNNDDVILFTMSNAVARWSLFDRPDAGASTSTALTIPLALNTGGVDEDDEKYLRTVALRNRLTTLAGAVEAHEPFDDPEAAHEKARKLVDRLGGETVQLGDELKKLHRGHDEADAEAQRLRYLIREKTQERSGLTRSREDLERQLGELVRNINEIEGATELEQIEKRNNLRAELERVKAKIKGILDQDQELEKVITGAGKRLGETELTATALAVEKSKKERDLAEKERDRSEQREIAHQARAQRDLGRTLLRIHQRLAWALSVLGFALIGVSLGIMAGGRSVVAAFGISFVVVLVTFYLPLSVVPPVAAAHGWSVAFAVWLGNGVTFVLGCCLMARAARG